MNDQHPARAFPGKGIAHGLVAHTCGFPIGKRELLGNVAELGQDRA
jgi:hypothetical protein